MSPRPDACRHGHIDWMIQRQMFDKDRGTDGRHYFVWAYLECRRLQDLAHNKRRLDKSHKRKIRSK